AYQAVGSGAGIRLITIGKITIWNDPAIANDNPDGALSQIGLAYGAVKSSEGEFMTPSPGALTSPATSALPIIQSAAHDLRILITNATGTSSCPTVSLTWLRVQSDRRNATKHTALDFVKWVLTEGQSLAAKLGDAPLPQDLIEAELRQIE